ncbi:MAG: nucleotidyltransferase family protein [Candidatus Freyarchaeota archaeon]
MREIARRAGASPSETKKELDNLVHLGVLRKHRRGNQLLFAVNTQCPFLSELRSFYIKTDGVAEQLRKTLSKKYGVKYAFIFGSLAAGSFSQKSDVDILIIGSIDEEEIARDTSHLQKITGREINWVLWSERDFASKLKEKGSFITSVLRGKRIWLKGDESEFERITSKATG